jgi:hypothetical protein
VHAKPPKEHDTTLETKRRVPVPQKLISKRTLRVMDAAMANYGKGIRSKPIDTDEMRRVADALPE